MNIVLGQMEHLAKSLLVVKIQQATTIFKILKDKKVKVQLNLIKDAEHNYVAFKERVPTFISFLTDNSNRI